MFSGQIIILETKREKVDFYRKYKTKKKTKIKQDEFVRRFSTEKTDKYTKRKSILTSISCMTNENKGTSLYGWIDFALIFELFFFCSAKVFDVFILFFQREFVAEIQLPSVKRTGQTTELDINDEQFRTIMRQTIGFVWISVWWSRSNVFFSKENVRKWRNLSKLIFSSSSFFLFSSFSFVVVE